MLVLAFLLAVGSKHFLYCDTKTDGLTMFQFGAKIGPRSEGPKMNMANIQGRMEKGKG